MDKENNKRLQDLLNEETTNYITDYAKALSSKKEVVEMLGVPDELKEAMMFHPVFLKAYNIGKLQSEYDIRAAVVKLAINGSAPAQIEAVKLIDKLRIENA
jgi:hypothetical protein